MSDVPPGTEDRPVELVPRSPATIGLWLLLLAGPIIWVLHFGVVYFAAEASCAASATPEMWFMGPDALVGTILAATVVATAVAALTAVYSWRRARRGDGDDAHLGRAGFLLTLGSIVAVLAVGLPALVLDPC
jgi:uncharacterized membrane protein